MRTSLKNNFPQYEEVAILRGILSYLLNYIKTLL